MPITSNNAVCEMLKSEYNIISKTYKGKNRATNKALKAKHDIEKMVRKIKNSIPSPFDLLDDKLLDLKNEMDSKLPDPNDIQDIVDIMKNCAFFNVEDEMSAAMSFYNKSCENVRNELSSLGQGFADIIPEFDFFSNMGNLKTKNDSDNLKKLDQIIECINSICGPSYLSELSEMIEDVNGIYDKMSINDDPASENYGEIDLDKITTDSSVDLGGVSKISNSFGEFGTSIDQSKNSSVGSIISKFIV